MKTETKGDIKAYTLITVLALALGALTFFGFKALTDDISSASKATELVTEIANDALDVKHPFAEAPAEVTE